MSGDLAVEAELAELNGWDEDLRLARFARVARQEAEVAQAEDAAWKDAEETPREMTAFRLAVTGRPIPSHAAIMARETGRGDSGFVRNPFAELGSEANPVNLDFPPAAPKAQRSQPTELDQLLDRAHAITDDQEMERRESARARSRRYAEYLRGQGRELSARMMAPGYSEISR